MHDLGLVGIEIGTSVNEWRLDDPELEPFWAAADSLGAAVFVHPWDGLMSCVPISFWGPSLLG